MITIKLSIQIDVTKYLREANSVMRFAYNRFVEGKNLKEVRELCGQKSFGKFLGYWLYGCAIDEARTWFKIVPSGKLIFGGKQNLRLRSKNKISQDEWRRKRLHSLNSVGEKNCGGNRLFALDVINNNQISFKPNRNECYVIQLPRLTRSRFRQLCLLEEKSKRYEIPFTVRLNNDKISISFDEKIFKEQQVALNKRRVFAIDMNPNNVGYSVLEFDSKNDFRVVAKGLVDVSRLNVTSNLASNDSKSKYLTNKRRYELFQVSKRLVDLAKHYQCKKFAVEELQFEASRDCGFGKTFNRLVNNAWNRNLLVSNLQKRANIYRMEFVTVNSAYSSIVGNVIYGDETTPDSVASSIEIGRRAYKKFSKDWFYPKLVSVEALANRWKEALAWRIESWKDLFRELKNSKVKYRVPFDVRFASRVFSLNCSCSNVLCYEFEKTG